MSAEPSNQRTRTKRRLAGGVPTEWLEWATLGTACTELLHDLNNHFNSMLLQAATLQINADPTLRAELETIRREGTQAAARLRPLQQFRGRQKTDPTPIALNHVVRAALALLSDFGTPVKLRLAEPLPEIWGSATAIELLLWLTLRAAWSCRSPSEAPIWVRTLNRDGRVEVVVDSETRDDPTAGHDDIGLDALENVVELDRLAMKALVRQTAAAMKITRRATGGVGFRLSWKLGQE